MKIIVDAFGGDNSPLAVIQGSADAVKDFGITVILSGDEAKIKQVAKDNNVSLNGIEIIHSPSVIDIHEEPTSILKQHRDCSMAVGLQALADDKGDAFVCAGSTGALIVGATFIAKRMKGIKRPALAPVMPSESNYFMLLDAGANTDCRPEFLVQFAIMGTAYMKNVMGYQNPRVGLLNIGAEDTKGRELEVEAYKLLKQAPINFVGNCEARDIPSGKFDVIVSDGFTGNIALKLYEGMAKFFGNELKSILTSSLKSKIGALFLLDRVNEFKAKVDYKEVGGAVLLGISKPVIKAHGSSDARAFYNAIRQAKQCIDGKIIDTIKDNI